MRYTKRKKPGPRKIVSVNTLYIMLKLHEVSVKVRPSAQKKWRQQQFLDQGWMGESGLVGGKSSQMTNETHVVYLAPPGSEAFLAGEITDHHDHPGRLQPLNQLLKRSEARTENSGLVIP